MVITPESIGRRDFFRTAGAAGFAAALSAFLSACRREGDGQPVGSTGRPAEQSSRRAEQAPAATGLVYSPVYKQHDPGPGHPESPRRQDAITEALDSAGLAPPLRRIEPRDATAEQILTCHTKGYFETVREDIRSGQSFLSTGDTNLCPETWDAAVLAAGGAVAAVDAVYGGHVRNAFCAVRPPGHHATPTRGMGFCVFNNAAVAARYAQAACGAEKVLIADWDVHHGNGTQEIFYEDPTVLYFSTHQENWYPFTGARDETGRGEGEGTTINRPFRAGAGRDEILGAFRDDLRPAARHFVPDLVIVSAGFDSRKGDPLGRFTLTDEDFRDLTGVMAEIAGEHCDGRLVSLLEGGYHLDGLARATAAHVSALSEA